MTTYFSQRDPRWQAKPLGTSELTIGQAGCLITCIASILADHGVGTDPGRLNDWLNRTQGYVDDNLFLFGAVHAFGLDLTARQMCEQVAAPVGKIKQTLAAGGYVVAMVDFAPGGKVQPHWVRVLDTTDWRIADPWRFPGAEARTLGDYYAVGWNAARAIMGWAAYTPVKAAARSITHDFGQVAQPFICARQP